jgi:hypothetical protein
MKKYYRVTEERYITRTEHRRNVNGIGLILRRNCLIKHVIEGQIVGRITVKERRGRTGQQLLEDLKETRVYWKVKDAAMYRTLWRTCFGRSYGPAIGQAT